MAGDARAARGRTGASGTRVVRGRAGGSGTCGRFGDAGGSGTRGRLGDAQAVRGRTGGARYPGEEEPRRAETESGALGGVLCPGLVSTHDLWGNKRLS